MEDIGFIHVTYAENRCKQSLIMIANNYLEWIS